MSSSCYMHVLLNINLFSFIFLGQFLVGEILKRDGLELSFVWNRTTSVLRGKVDDKYILENLLSFAERYMYIFPRNTGY